MKINETYNHLLNNMMESNIEVKSMLKHLFGIIPARFAKKMEDKGFFTYTNTNSTNRGDLLLLDFSGSDFLQELSMPGASLKFVTRNADYELLIADINNKTKKDLFNKTIASITKTTAEGHLTIFDFSIIAYGKEPQLCGLKFFQKSGEDKFERKAIFTKPFMLPVDANTSGDGVKA